MADAKTQVQIQLGSKVCSKISRAVDRTVTCTHVSSKTVYASQVTTMVGPHIFNTRETGELKFSNHFRNEKFQT